ncbi:hypothetical protein [Thermomonospora umbrina]|uniref:Ig-like domain-containing protein n=1 Tax=Thermomonospora umbrina TaxID=111806 RepID=A0A3D9SL35_9ACTN|nr:hypothetical protein [Thermomonospora umbrina]REE96427.1 hypothetical protein DFJ69_1863 [Thermomonospora umbrina]
MKLGKPIAALLSAVPLAVLAPPAQADPVSLACATVPLPPPGETRSLTCLGQDSSLRGTLTDRLLSANVVDRGADGRATDLSVTWYATVDGVHRPIDVSVIVIRNATQYGVNILPPATATHVSTRLTP